MAREEKDKWDKASIVIKGFLATAVTVILGVLGYYNDTRQHENNQNLAKMAENNRIAQIQVQTMNNREIAATQMRVQMFKTLMEKYFDPNNDVATKITTLELVGLNFQNHLYLKPLFLKLNEELANDNIKKEKLRKVGKEINRFEIDNIVGNGGQIYDFELKINEIYQHKLLHLQLLSLTNDSIHLKTREDDTNGFEVTFFDMPFMDNSTLGGYTYSILLSDVDLKEQKASVKLVEFPTHYNSTRNQLLLDAKIADMTEEEVLDGSDENTSVFLQWFSNL